MRLRIMCSNPAAFGPVRPILIAVNLRNFQTEISATTTRFKALHARFNTQTEPNKISNINLHIVSLAFSPSSSERTSAADYREDGEPMRQCSRRLRLALRPPHLAINKVFNSETPGE